jgi:hypothetical protein
LCFVAILLAGLRLDTGTVATVLDITGDGILVVVVAAYGAMFIPGTDHACPARTVAPPVAGRWLAFNSPASKVPSHGTRAYGQAYAIDLVYEPDDDSRPKFGSGPGMLAPERFPAFGQPVLSMVSGTVVRVRDRARDHRSRTARWSMLYLFLEGMLREIGGPGRLLGNHIVVDTGDGYYAMVAHLQRGSAGVREGDTVSAGDLLGRCGNSGNSTEPHVHAQLMDRAAPSVGLGLPMRFAGIDADAPGSEGAGMPATHQHLTVSR